MDKILIRGGVPLRGSLLISGAKNAALPLMAASLLTEDTLTLTNLPHLADIVTMANLLVQHGVSFMMDGSAALGETSGRVILLNANRIPNRTAPYDIVRKMRASVLVLGPLLARFGEARVSLPGGCAIGTRPIDLHLSAFEKMGAKVRLEDGYIYAHVPGRLKGAEIHFDKVSVGATENILMAASLADGKTVLTNAAMEPEITDLAQCLCKMGAKISGIGTSTLEIEGVTSLHGAHYPVVPDRIEAGTYAAAAVITRGDIELQGVTMELMQTTLDKLVQAGATVTKTENGIRVAMHEPHIRPVDVVTEPFPGFATDMQAQFLALMTVANGSSSITETIFENRFMHVPELHRMGAHIIISGNSAMVTGVPKLLGAPVMATDLRASVSLVLAGLVAEGETVINRVYHLDRGYERIEEKLKACGALIERIS